MRYRKTLIFTLWIGFLAWGFSTTLTHTPFTTDELTENLDPKFTAQGFERVVVNEKGPVTHILAKHVLYTKNSDGYTTSFEGPVECIVDNIELKEYVPSHR